MQHCHNFCNCCHENGRHKKCVTFYIPCYFLLEGQTWVLSSKCENIKANFTNVMLFLPSNFLEKMSLNAEAKSFYQHDIAEKTEMIKV